MRSNHVSHRIVKLEAVRPDARNPWDDAEQYRGLSVARLRGVLNAVADPQDWKAPWSAAVPEGLVQEVKAAIEFFHADSPLVHGKAIAAGSVIMSGKGYQA